MKEQNPTEERNLQEVKMQLKVYKQSKEQDKEAQRLKVQVFSKQNPFKEQKSSQIPTDQYGPFENSQTQKQHQFHMKNFDEGVNYEIEISPVLTNLSPERVFSKKNQKNVSKQKHRKFSNILTNESTNEFQFSKVDEKKLQRQIMALAKNIRQKVRRKESKNDNTHEKLSPQMSPSKKQNDTQMNKLQQKRNNLLQKYSFPKSVNSQLNDTEKDQAHVGQFLTQRVYRQQQQQQSPQHQKTPVTEKHHKPAKIHFLSQSRTHQHKKQRSPPQLPRLKLNLDKTHHRYEMNEFRKIILKEKKDMEIAKSLLIKEKEHALQKRRQVYNQSRYHPVGIRLNALRTQKLPNLQQNLHQKQAETGRPEPQEEHKEISYLSLTTPQKQNHLLPQKDQDFQKVTNPQNANPSAFEVKSSLTFNFSLSNSPNPTPEIKTQVNQEDLQYKKCAQMGKQMTENNHIMNQQPSRPSLQEHQPYYSDIELQYSEI